MVLRKFWNSYTAYMRVITLGAPDHEVKDLVYWQDHVFYKTISYALPLSILLLVFYILLSLKEGLVFEALISSLTLVLISLVCFNAKVSLTFKKTFIAVILTLMAIVSLLMLGNFGVGSLYLLALSVFIALHFSAMVAYGTVVFNALLYTCLAVVIHLKGFNLPVVKEYTTAGWIGYSLNFLFFNLVVVYQISNLLYGLKSTFNKQQRLATALKLEVEENVKQNLSLRESEDHYRSLFFNNPTPMWIFDAQTLKFLQVNSAAVTAYGYAEDEFLQLSITTIKLHPDDFTLAEKIRIIENDGTFYHRTQHKRKSGEVFHADINCSTIPFKGKKAILTIASDITTHVEHLQKIEIQNERFKEIAYLQSHVIRAPLARMKGLYQLISLNEDEAPDKEIMSHFYASLNEMDQVIHTIVNHNEENSAQING